jgi:hypothetical protein
LAIEAGYPAKIQLFCGNTPFESRMTKNNCTFAGRPRYTGKTGKNNCTFAFGESQKQRKSRNRRPTGAL